MKRPIILLLCCFHAALATIAQTSDSLFVAGRFLYNHCNEKIILRGVNYSVLDDWDFPANMNNGNERSIEIEKSGANCVRLQWYNNYAQLARPAYNLVHLDSLLTRSKRLHIIPIVGLWDMTCSNDWGSFTNVITNWWTQPAVLALIEKHKRYMILNIANEFGYYQWTGNPAAALTTFKNNYKTAITTLRNAGIKVPLMIDAPDCGQNIDALVLVGQELVNHDPLHNILLSAHSYWTGYVGNDSATMANKIQQAVASNLPLVMGEIANYQSDAQPCQYNLNYPDLLESLKIKEVGWLAWTWFKDYCSSREMTPTGLYSQLNTYGNDLVNNSIYGLKNTATKNPPTFNACSAILPLQLLSMDLLHYNGYPMLKTNYAGTSLAQLAIEKSTDQSHWKTLQTWRLSNASGSTRYVDYQQNQATTYYRAVITDLQGALFYGPVKAFQKQVKPLEIWPNPASKKVTVRAAGIRRVNLFDQSGRCVAAVAVNNQNSVDLNVERLMPGIYHLECLAAGNIVFRNRVIIKH
ncbi:MAG: cellulase family glycosylhydrolase [Bacteroidota bacterium]